MSDTEYLAVTLATGVTAVVGVQIMHLYEDESGQLPAEYTLRRPGAADVREAAQAITEGRFTRFLTHAQHLHQHTAHPCTSLK